MSIERELATTLSRHYSMLLHTFLGRFFTLGMSYLAEPVSSSCMFRTTIDFANIIDSGPLVLILVHLLKSHSLPGACLNNNHSAENVFFFKSNLTF